MSVLTPPKMPFGWNRLDCAGNPLNLSITLRSGQSFRWRRDEAGVWWGVVENTALTAWQEEDAPDSPLYWQTFPVPDQTALIHDYFRFEVDLEARAAEWVRAEPRIAEAVGKFRGLRILRQPPEECFFGFLCATAKPVVQIERLVWNLAARYGAPMETEWPALALHVFPTLEALAAAEESDLRAAGWGFRAPRVVTNACHLTTQEQGWLRSLRRVSYAEARAALLGLSGIGAKVADCICLFSLDKDEAAPIDRHIQRIGCRLFHPDLAGKTLTPAVYDALADAYRERFGAFAGWAQQYLFLEALNRNPA